MLGAVGVGQGRGGRGLEDPGEQLAQPGRQVGAGRRERDQHGALGLLPDGARVEAVEADLLGLGEVVDREQAGPAAEADQLGEAGGGP